MRAAYRWGMTVPGPLVLAGAEVVAEHGTDHVVMSDSEGNEFCVV